MNNHFFFKYKKKPQQLLRLMVEHEEANPPIF